MQDLLNEKDFILSKYNPWQRFRRFYALTVIQVLLLQICMSIFHFGNSVLLIFIVYLLLPVVTVVWMFTSDTRNFLLERKVKVLAVLGLVTTFTVMNFLIYCVKIVYQPVNFILLGIWQQFITSILLFFAQFVICLAVMFLVSRLIKLKLVN